MSAVTEVYVEEKRFERKLIRYLRDGGFYAVHMETGVDGWPDIFAMRRGKVFLIEVKDAARGIDPSKLFEKSQPPLYWKLLNNGARVHVALCSDDRVSMYAIEFVLGDIQITLNPLCGSDYRTIPLLLEEY